MEFLKKASENAKAENEARKMMGQMMIDAILESDAPESMKADMRIMQAMRQLDDEIHSLVEKVTLDTADTYSVQDKKGVCEYLLLVAEGVKNYIGTLAEQLANNKNENKEN